MWPLEVESEIWISGARKNRKVNYSTIFKQFSFVDHQQGGKMFVPVEIQAATHNKKHLEFILSNLFFIVYLGNSCFPPHMEARNARSNAALVYRHAN